MFGKNLKRVRILKNRTPEAVAECLGISKETYLAWESGEVIPTVDVVEPLALCLHVSCVEFFRNIDDYDISDITKSVRFFCEFEKTNPEWYFSKREEKTPESRDALKLLHDSLEPIDFHEMYINEYVVMGYFNCTKEEARKFLALLLEVQFIFPMQEEDYENSMVLEFPEDVENYIFVDDIFVTIRDYYEEDEEED